jgi:ribosomal RNA assembly protein
MEEIFIESLGKIRKLKRRIEKSLNVKLTLTKDKVNVESEKGDAFSEYIGGKILESLDLGFDFKKAMQLKDEEFMLEKISIKRFARPTRLRQILGRIIGKKGKAIKTLSLLTDCSIAVSDYTVALIGRTEDVDVALLAVMKLIRGAPHAKVYGFLERQKALKREAENLEL